MGKRSGMGSGPNKKKSKPKRKHGPEAVAMKRQGSLAQSAAPNPFETIWTRKKFNVVGKKQKGAGRKVGQSRAAGVEKRKKTLLQEYKQLRKSNTFLDHRFGEKDEGLTEDDKAILRFQRERLAQISRGSKFTLADADDENEELLTHGGAALSTLDDFQDDVPDNDEDTAAFGEDVFKELHFGGETPNQRQPHSSLEGDGQHQRSKKEIMEEVISKSKFFKAQKAKEKEEDQDLREKLDKDFASLAQSQALLSLVRPKKVNALKALLAKKDTEIDASSTRAADLSVPEKEMPDDYEKLMKEMVFDMRAHAADRMKTAEELIAEEKERLEELEKKRRKRMLGEGSSESEGDESEDEGSRKQRKKKKREISGDDLGENFVMEDENEENGWVDEVLARKGEDEDEEDEESGSEGSGSDSEDDLDSGKEEEVEKDNEQKTDGDHPAISEERIEGETVHIGEINQSMECVTGHHIVTSDRKTTGAAQPKGSESGMAVGLVEEGNKASKDSSLTAESIVDEVRELPFVIKAPQSLEEFRKLVDDRSDEELAIAVHRIRTCNAISLAAENRKRMQVFYGVLIQYFAALASEKPLLYVRLNTIVKPLLELGSETPYFAAQCARQRIIHMQNLLSEKLRNSDGRTCWPSARTISLLRLWSMSFPPSDFRHPVMTPAMLLMSEYLIRCPVNSCRDVAVGAFLCSLLLTVMQPGRRFCPEALCFMYALLLSALPSSSDAISNSLMKYCPAFMLQLMGSRSWLLLQKKVAAVEDLDFVSLMSSADSSPVFEDDVFRVGILHALLQTLKGFMGIYDDISSYPEIFSPFILVMRELATRNKYPERLELLVSDMIERGEAKVTHHEMMRQPLRMRVKKPVAIKQFNPKFEEDFAVGRDYDVDRERSEKKKLIRQVKREAKGAARELRKDNYFVQEEKRKERAMDNEERGDKYKKAMAFLQEQEHAFKSGQLGKGRKKRRN